jgi:hypothetical protein
MVVFVAQDYTGEGYCSETQDDGGMMAVVKKTSDNLRVGAAMGGAFGLDPSGEDYNLMAGSGVISPGSDSEAFLRGYQGTLVN